MRFAKSPTADSRPTRLSILLIGTCILAGSVGCTGLATFMHAVGVEGQRLPLPESADPAFPEHQVGVPYDPRMALPSYH